MSRAISVLVMFLLVGCGTITSMVASPTSVTAIARDDAIKLGLQVADSGGPEIRTLMVDPKSGHADLTMLARAMKQLTGSETVPRGDQPNAPIWIVTFEGQWQDAFPRTTEMPTPEILAHFFVIIDANTGGDGNISATH